MMSVAAPGWNWEASLAEPFPEEVNRFLDEFVESLDQLEVLRLLWERPNVTWTDSTLAAEVQIESSYAATQLAILDSRGCDGPRPSALLHDTPPGGRISD